LKIYLFIRELESEHGDGEGQREREGESQAGSTPCTGLDPTDLRS